MVILLLKKLIVILGIYSEIVMMKIMKRCYKLSKKTLLILKLTKQL